MVTGIRHCGSRRLAQQAAWLTGVWLAVWFCWGVAVYGEEPTLADWVSKLAADDYAVRQAATVHLLQDEQLNLSALAGFFTGSESAEQRHRIVDVLRHHLIRQAIEKEAIDDNLASIGIGLFGLPADQTPRGKRSAIAVTATYPGFPGYAYLQKDDLIETINNQRIPASLDQPGIQQFCKDLIQNTGVGEMINLTVARHGEPLEIQFKLQPYSALGEFYQTRNTSRLVPTLKAEREQAIVEKLEGLIPGLEEFEPLQLEISKQAFEWGGDS